MTNNTAEATPRTAVEEMWKSRPVRIPREQGGSGSIIAGVCEGIGARYVIDPVIIRIAFVALTLAFGGGIFLYLLLWLVMPRFGMTTSPWQALVTPKAALSPAEREDRTLALWLLIGLALFFPSLMASSGDIAFGSIMTFLLTGMSIYLLHRAHPVAPASLSAHGYSVPVPDAPKADTSSLTTPEGYPHPDTGRAHPPRWDPLGTAPDLWYLPDPTEEPVVAEQKPRKRRWWIWIAGIICVEAVLIFSAVAAGSALFHA